MLSDRDATERALRGMIENDEAYDPGLEAAQTLMRATEAELNDGYIDNPRESPSYGRLCEKWEFTGSAVDIVGRVYVDDEKYIHTIPDSWQPRGEDEYGLWFSVPGGTFVSTGVSAITPNATDGAVQTTGRSRVAYSLMFPEDFDIEGDDEEDDDLAQFFAFPDEVIPQFHRLSSMGVEHKLRRLHPEIMARVDQALPKDVTNMSRKIHRLRKLLPDIEIDDEVEISMLGEYISSRLEPDTEWPYLVRLENEVGLAGRNGQTEKLMLQVPVEQYVRLDGLGLTRVQDSGGLKGIMVLCPAPSRQTDDDDDSEKIYAPLESIVNLQTLRPYRSLREQAKANRHEKIIPAIGRVTGVLIGHNLDATTLPVEKSPLSVHRETKFEKLTRQQFAIAGVMQIVRESRETTYDVRSEALGDLHALTQEIVSILKHAGLYNGVPLSVSGEGIVRPDATYSETKGSFSVQVNGGSLLPVDSFEVKSGTLLNVMEQLEAFPDEAGGLRYKHNPLLQLANPNIHLGMKGVPHPLVAASIFESTLVPLGGEDVTIEVTDYKLLHDRTALLQVLRTRTDERSRSLTDKLTRVERAFYRETPGSFVSLRNIQRIRDIGDEIMADPSDELSFAALSSLFADGQMLFLNGALASARGDVEAQAQGKFAGIVMDYPYTDRPRLSFVIVTRDDIYRYFPIDGLKGLSF